MLLCSLIYLWYRESLAQILLGFRGQRQIFVRYLVPAPLLGSKPLNLRKNSDGHEKPLLGGLQ